MYTRQETVDVHLAKEGRTCVLRYLVIQLGFKTRTLCLCGFWTEGMSVLALSYDDNEDDDDSMSSNQSPPFL